MALRVIWTPYGRAAAEQLACTIRELKAGEPLAPVGVVVPSNHVGVAARRLLASGELGPLSDRGTGLAAVSFLTVYRMAELVGSADLAARGRRPVSTPVLAAALRRALEEDPGVFAPVAGHPATEMALVTTYKELRDVSLDGLGRLAGCSTRSADVVRLYHSVREHLVADWYDEEDLINAAAKVLERDGSALGDLRSVVVYLPERLSRHGALLLRTVSGICDMTVIAGTTGDTGADAEVVRSIGRLAPFDGPPSSPAGRDPMSVVSAQRTRIAATSDADEETREAVRAVMDALRQGISSDRIAVLYGSHDPYARLVHEHFSAAGIAHNGSSVIPLTSRLAGRTLLGLFTLPGSSFRREEVFSWLAGSRLFHRRRPVPVTAWERVSREAGVVRGRDHWDGLLTTYAEDCEADAKRAEGDPDSPAWRAESLRNEAARASGLREFVLALIDDLADAAASLRPWSEHAKWAHGIMDSLIGSESRRSRWPLVEQKAAERVERALDRLGCLDAVEGPVDLEVFARTLELELEADLGRVGRMGEGVLVGSLRMGVGLDLDLVVVLGLAEGSCPAPLRDDSLLPDHEREAAGDELDLRAQGVDRQHAQLLATLAGASRQVLCVPRGDLRRSTERIPSRWVLEIASCIEGRRVWSDELRCAERPWLAHVASYDAGLRRVGFPATEQEYRLRALLSEDGHFRGRPKLDDPVFNSGIEVVVSRRSDLFTRFDGNLEGLPVPSPVNRDTSSTRLEGWAICPFAYLLHEIFRIEEVENPEERLQISPLDQGSLIHEVLERFISEVLARPPSAQPSPQERWSATDRARMLEIAESVCASYESHGLTGRPIFWQRDKRRILSDLMRFLDEDSVHRAACGTRPIAAELAFGVKDAALGSVSMELPDGRKVLFRGRADRVDLACDGTAHVVDYKTGKPDNYKQLSQDNPDLQGTKLQLVVYGLAARLQLQDARLPVHAEYWFTSSRGRFERVGYDVTDDVLERVAETVGRMVNGIEHGVFPNHPTATSTTPFVECAFCDPDAMGVADLYRRTERKRADPRVAPYFDLVDPPPVDADDAEASVD